MKIAWVKWFDASYQRGECTAEELVPVVYLESAGLLVQETEETVTIALDSYAQDDTWRYIEHIPKVNITNMHVWEISEQGDEGVHAGADHLRSQRDAI